MFWVQVWSNWSGPQTHYRASHHTELLIFLSPPHKRCIAGSVPPCPVCVVQRVTAKVLCLLEMCSLWHWGSWNMFFFSIVVCLYLSVPSRMFLEPYFPIHKLEISFFFLSYSCCLRLLSGHMACSGLARSYGRFPFSFLKILHTDFYRTGSSSQSQQKRIWALPSPYCCQLFSGLQTFWVG